MVRIRVCEAKFGGMLCVLLQYERVLKEEAEEMVCDYAFPTTSPHTRAKHDADS